MKIFLIILLCVALLVPAYFFVFRGRSGLVEALEMPGWLATAERDAADKIFESDEEKLRFTIGLATENVKRGTGGPFGAAIFDAKTHRLVAVGVNRVVPANQSWAHAEMTAFARAQNKRKTYALNGCVLVTSCEPCAMCYGATPWSGVDAMIYGATKADAESVGFDEGDKGEAWKQALAARGIRVVGPLLSEESKAPFELYKRSAGTVY